jgi:hypothetical protein
MKNICLLLLAGLFILICSNLFSQPPTPSESKSLLEYFDEIVLADTTYKIAIQKDPDKVIPSEAKKGNSRELIFDEKKTYSYEFVYNVLCNPKIPEKEKLNFFQSAIDHNSRNTLNQFSFKKCDCLETQLHIRQLLIDYFQKQDENPGYYSKTYKYFHFTLINGFPNAYELIQDYLQTREDEKNKYRLEGQIPAHLVRMGKEKEALELLEKFVFEFETGKIKYPNFGDIGEKGNSFVVLNFSENPEVSQKAAALTFEYFRHLPGTASWEFSKYLKYLGLEKYNEISLEKLETLKNKTERTSRENEAIRLLLITHNSLLIERTGFDYWNTLLSHKNLWKYEKDFNAYMSGVAFDLSKIELTNDQKNTIINFYLDKDIFLNKNQERKDDARLRKFIQLYLRLYPDGEISDLTPLIPERYRDNTDWAWEFHDYKRRKSQPKKKTQKRLTNFKEIGEFLNQHGAPVEIKSDPYYNFLLEAGFTSKSSILLKSKRIIWFDAEGGYYPLDYNNLFENSFRPAFVVCGEDFITVTSECDQSQDLGHYTLQVNNGQSTYQFEYDDNSDWYHVYPFVKALNLALMDLKSNYRLITFDSGDQTVNIILTEPDKFLPYAARNLYYWAVKDGDDLFVTIRNTLNDN